MDEQINTTSIPHNRMLFRNKRDEILIHATTWIKLKNSTLRKKKSYTKDCIRYDSIHMKCPEKANL